MPEPTYERPCLPCNRVARLQPGHTMPRPRGFDEEPLLASLHINTDEGLDQDVRVFQGQAPKASHPTRCLKSC